MEYEKTADALTAKLRDEPPEGSAAAIFTEGYVAGVSAVTGLPSALAMVIADNAEAAGRRTWLDRHWLAEWLNERGGGQS